MMRPYAILVVLVLVLSVLFIPPVAAENATIDDVYNVTGIEDQEEWMVGLDDVSLESIVTLLLRFPAFILIGSGSGEIVAGMLVTAFVVASVGVNRVGIVAGGVVGVSAMMAIAAVGIAPVWVDAAAMMLIGLVLAVVYLRFK